jgi:hypothetical protein
VRPDARPSKHSALRGPARINTLAITKLTLAVRPRGQRRDRLNLGSLRAHHAHLGSSSKQPTGPTRKPRLRIGRAPSVSCTAITLATARRSESEPADARGDWSSSKVLATRVDDSSAGSARAYAQSGDEVPAMPPARLERIAVSTMLMSGTGTRCRGCRWRAAGEAAKDQRLPAVATPLRGHRGSRARLPISPGRPRRCRSRPGAGGGRASRACPWPCR